VSGTQLQDRLAGRGRLIGASLLVAFGAAVLFGVLGEEIQDREPVPVDTGGGQFLHGYSSGPLDAVMTFASFLGSAWFVIPLLVLVVILLLRRRRLAEAVFLCAVYAGSGTLNFLLKLYFQRARPQFPWASGPTDFSFPSGHAMNSLVFYFGLVLVTWIAFGRRVGLAILGPALLVVILVGVSRVYLGYHYVSDVLGGWSAGLVWLIVATLAMRPLWKLVEGRLPNGRWSRFGAER
jgi:undecaprenyl-diphosphatase